MSSMSGHHDLSLSIQPGTGTSLNFKTPLPLVSATGIYMVLATCPCGFFSGRRAESLLNSQNHPLYASGTM